MALRIEKLELAKGVAQATPKGNPAGDLCRLAIREAQRFTGAQSEASSGRAVLDALFALGNGGAPTGQPNASEAARANPLGLASPPKGQPAHTDKQPEPTGLFGGPLGALGGVDVDTLYAGGTTGPYSAQDLQRLYSLALSAAGPDRRGVDLRGGQIKLSYAGAAVYCAVLARGCDFSGTAAQLAELAGLSSALDALTALVELLDRRIAHLQRGSGTLDGGEPVYKFSVLPPELV